MNHNNANQQDEEDENRSEEAESPLLAETPPEIDDEYRNLVSQQYDDLLHYRTQQYAKNSKQFGLSAYHMPYLEALKQAREKYTGEATAQKPSWDDDGLSAFAQLRQIRDKASQYYRDVYIDPQSLHASNPWKDTDLVKTIRLQPPSTGTIVDRTVTLLLHIDGKPATPRSNLSTDYIIYSYRVLNGNSYDLRSDWILIPILVLPKNNMKEGFNVEEWRADMLGITDCILLHANTLGLNGLYIKLGPNMYEHLTWNEVTISGDSVQIAELQGNPGVNSSRQGCTITPYCKQDRLRVDQGTYIDIQNTFSHDNTKCRVHTLRSAPYNSAPALLPIIAGKYEVNGQSIQQILKDIYPWLDENFVNDATVIQNIIKPFFLDGTFFFLPPSPLHPVLRRVVQCELLKKQIEDGRLNFPDRGKKQEFSVKETGHVNVVEFDKDYLVDIPYPFARSVSFSDSIFGLICVSSGDFSFPIPECISQAIEQYPVLSSLLGENDPFILDKQYKLLVGVMMIPYIGGEVMDGMHLNANEIRNLINTLCGKTKKEQIGILRDFFAKYFKIPYEKSFIIVSERILSELNKMLGKIPSSLKIPQFSIDSLKGKSMNIISKLGQSWFSSLTYQLDNSLFEVHCVRQILNLNAVLYASRANISTLISAQALGNVFQSLLEGKMHPQDFTPTNHNNSHNLDTIISVSPHATSNNYAPESMYAVIAKNMLNSNNMEITMNKRTLAFMRISCLLQRKNYIRLFALVANAVGLISPYAFPHYEQLFILLNAIKNITMANILDDYGFSYCEYYFRNTYLDNPNCDDKSALEYIKSFPESKWSVRFCSQSIQLFEVCRWRDGHIYKSVIPQLPLTGSFLKEHSNEIAFTMNNKGIPQLFLICGYVVCLIDNIPYIQALCLKIPYKFEHILMSLHYLVLDFDDQSSYTWKLVSLYRLHLKEVIIEEREENDKENNGFVAHIDASIYSQTNNMTDCWEFYDFSNKLNMIDPRDAHLVYRIKNNTYDNTKLQNSTQYSKTLAINNHYGIYYQRNSLDAVSD